MAGRAWASRLKRSSIHKRKHNTMGRPKKIKEEKKITAPEDEGVGVPGLFPVGQWDIDEELQGNEALREFQREQQPEF